MLGDSPFVLAFIQNLSFGIFNKLKAQALKFLIFFLNYLVHV